MKLYVGNLGVSGDIKSEDLRPLFEQFGQVSECECIKNYAFVHMDDADKADEAVRALNGTSVKGRNIKVEKSESRGPRKPSQKLFVGNLAEGTTNADLKELFARFAPVMEADVIRNYGFVHIDADAGKGKINEILRELNGYNLNGSQIRVQQSTSGVRQKPGMSGDQCYSGREGGRGGRGGSGGRGGPMRGSAPYGGRNNMGGQGMGGGGYGHGRGPYPPPPPPSYMRERNYDNGGPDNGGYGGGADAYGRQGGNGGGGGRDPYGRPSQPMYDDRRGGGGGNNYPPPMGGGGGRDMGGAGGPMRGPDPYGRYDQQDMGGGYNMGPPGGYGGSSGQMGGYGGGGGGYGGGGQVQSNVPAYSTQPAYSTGNGGGADMYSRRSPGPAGPPQRGGPPPPSGGGYMSRGMPPSGGAPGGGGYGQPPQQPAGGYGGGGGRYGGY